MIGLPSLHALDGAPGPRIWLAAEAANMRCGFDRLAERVKAVVGEDPLGGLLGAKKREKGGGGGVFAGIASYVVDGVDVGRWLPVCFCALLRHLLRCFGEGRAARAKARTGLAFVVSHPCLKNRGTARMGHPAVATIFRKFSCMVVPSGRLLLLCAFGS